MPQDQLICVATAANATQAHQWRLVLEEAGIACSVVDHLDAEFWKGPCPRAEVWVHAADAERARSALEAQPNGRAPDEGDVVHPRHRPVDQHGEEAQRELRRQGTDGSFRRPASRGK
jgi:hypothetical protein